MIGYLKKCRIILAVLLVALVSVSSITVYASDCIPTTKNPEVCAQTCAWVGDESSICY